MRVDKVLRWTGWSHGCIDVGVDKGLCGWDGASKIGHRYLGLLFRLFSKVFFSKLTIILSF